MLQRYFALMQFCIWLLITQKITWLITFTSFNRGKVCCECDPLHVPDSWKNNRWACLLLISNFKMCENAFILVKSVCNLCPFLCFNSLTLQAWVPSTTARFAVHGATSTSRPLMEMFSSCTLLATTSWPLHAGAVIKTLTFRWEDRMLAAITPSKVSAWCWRALWWSCLRALWLLMANRKCFLKTLPFLLWILHQSNGTYTFIFAARSYHSAKEGCSLRRLPPTSKSKQNWD